MVTPASVISRVMFSFSGKATLIAVTNYFYFRQNELEIIREEIARQNLNITVLGNVEFRLDQQNKAGDY
jgi:transketolase C-terminal domain/subunit